MTMIADQSTVQEAATIIEASKVPVWRLRLLDILQVTSIAVFVLGSIEAVNLVQIFSPEVGEWLAISGIAARFAAEPLINLLGDYLDDGVRNSSFKLNK